MYTGSCLCKKISFKVKSFEPHTGHCHCKMCQKFHGAAFSTFAEVKLENLYWLAGQNLLSHYTAENQTVRSFCKECGSSLLFESSYNKQDKSIEVSLASFDEPLNIKPNAHIYTESKAHWYSINDELPQYLTYRVE